MEKQARDEIERFAAEVRDDVLIRYQGQTVNQALVEVVREDVLEKLAEAYPAHRPQIDVRVEGDGPQRIKATIIFK